MTNATYRPVAMKILNHKKHRPFEVANPEIQKKKTKSPLNQDSFIEEKGPKPVFNFVKNKGLQSITRFAQELNINDIRQKYKNQDSNMLNLSDGTALLLALNQRNL